jgi:hypothetical protein
MMRSLPGEQRLLGMSVSKSDHLHTRQGRRPMREGHGIVHGAMPDRDIRKTSVQSLLPASTKQENGRESARSLSLFLVLSHSAGMRSAF